MKRKGNVLIMLALLLMPIGFAGCSDDEDTNHYEGRIIKIYENELVLGVITSPKNPINLTHKWIVCDRSDFPNQELLKDQVISFMVIEYEKIVLDPNRMTNGWEIPDYKCKVKPCK